LQFTNAADICESPMLNYALIDNQILRKDEIKISPFDRGLLFGDGVFTTLLIEEGRPIFFHAHQRRLHKQAKELGIKAPLISYDAVKDLIKHNQAELGTYKLKFVVTGGNTDVQGFKKRVSGSMIGYMEFFQPRSTPLKLTVFPKPMESPSAHLKTLAYLDRFLIMNWTKEKGFDDCLIVDSKFNILETLFANIFWVHAGTFFYPDPQLDLVLGITLQILQEEITKLGYKLQPIQTAVGNIPKKANIFLANSLIGFFPVVNIQEQQYPRDEALEQAITTRYLNIKHLY
jgi:4-amino-4-deoxychorismate lyase